MDWAFVFVEENKKVRKNGNYMLLILHVYVSYLQFYILQLMQENNMVFVALPSHTFHVLQPLDMTVFAAYKSI